MRTFKTVGVLVAVLPALACDQQGDGPGKNVTIATAPLSLPGVQDACYTIEVRNDLNQPVWVEEHVCATQFGNNIGDITYVGPCDAQNNDSVGAAENTVTLTLENLYTAPHNPSNYALGAIADSEWENPCSRYADGSEVSPNGDGHAACQLTFDCLENQDVQVEFNIVVVRDADQGFFDIAVNFEDIFCSAKVDCADQLLFNPTTDERDETAILAFACSAGEGADTHLYLSDVYLACTIGGGFYNTTRLDPSAGFGNQGVTATMEDGYGTSLADPKPDDIVVNDYAIYAGTEQLGDLNKAYWNIAIQLDTGELFNPFRGSDGALIPTSRSCFIHAWGTASDGYLDDAATPVDSISPFVEFLVPLNGGTLQSPTRTLDCVNNGLDAMPAGGVNTEYDGQFVRTCFENELVPDFVADEVALNRYDQYSTPGPDMGSPNVTDKCQYDWETMPAGFGPIERDDPPVDVQIVFFHDANNNKTHDLGEQTIDGVSIMLVPTGAPFDGPTAAPYPSATTAGGGIATFLGHPRGTRQVVFNGPVVPAPTPPGWVPPYYAPAGPCLLTESLVPNSPTFIGVGGPGPDTFEFGFRCLPF